MCAAAAGSAALPGSVRYSCSTDIRGRRGPLALLIMTKATEQPADHQKHQDDQPATNQRGEDVAKLGARDEARRIALEWCAPEGGEPIQPQRCMGWWCQVARALLDLLAHGRVAEIPRRPLTPGSSGGQQPQR